MRPDPTTITFHRDNGLVTARINGSSYEEDFAASVLHRAGFVPVARLSDRFHRLPTAMTDPDEQRRTVTRAVDMLHDKGFEFSSDAELIDPGQPYTAGPQMSPGDQVDHLTRAISAASHTREAAAGLSELTAPGNGVLQQVIRALHATADWWEGLGEPADPHYANRLRHITRELDSYALEIRSMRDDLADRHTEHPTRGRPAADPDPATTTRVSGARSVSPRSQGIATSTVTAGHATQPGPPLTRPSSAPGR
ncbi:MULTISPECIES: hypothetical protein [unclassified Streptomyces]|uniref:hypothetical protein n=1 Tax=unclassified Streptomyces TaxID=2593676 RepID=UPI00081DE9B0|nr:MULTISPECIES: hypothetical protein [unclassified Streptomyces]MYZ34209.1 hypothetical protein [Streptomyces sp. SID4917]SCF65065.1 hypothetical protein GA0115259_1006517 [Streptomyces sp. MnatMP-M17]